MLAGPSITPAAFLYFALVFPKAELKMNQILFYLFFIIPVIASLLAVPTELYIKSISVAPWGIDFVAGSGYPFYGLFFGSYSLLAFITFIIKYRKSKGDERERIRYFFLGALVTALTGMLVNVVLPIFGITFLNKSGPISTAILVSFTAYAITKHRLMNISIVVSRAAAEVLTIIVEGGVYLGMVWLYRVYVSPSINLLFMLWTVIYGILVGHTYLRLRLFFQTTSDKLFLKGRYDYYKALSDASSRVGEKLELSHILKVLYDTFHDTVEISNPKVFLPEYFTEPDKTSGRYLVYDKTNYAPVIKGQEIRMDSPLVKELIDRRGPAIDVKAIGAALAVPCLLEDRLIALFALGHKLSEEAYTEEDLRLLKTLANQVAITLDHARSYEKIKAELEVTERQLERSQRLASIGTLTAGVTHEIRNPLTVIRAEAERLAHAERDLAYLKQFSDLVVKHVDRIAGIVQRMLGLAKEKPRHDIDVNMNELIDSTLELFPISRIKVSKSLGNIPSIKGDPDSLQEIFVNLIQNAIEAMPDGGNLIINTYREDGRVGVEVSDTGKGIPEEIRERIFDPFYSTRHEGVGLGLSIVYRIVREHGGDIQVMSEVGKGSTFKLLF